MRLIDADTVISFVDAGHLRNPMELSWSDKDVVDMIESRPTVDAVPVEWFKNYIKRIEDNGNTFAAVQYEMMLWDYLADGERKDGK